MLSSVGPDTCAALVAATFVGLAAVRRCYAVDVPVLSHCNGFVSSKLLPRLSTLRQGYRPPLLHPTGLLQSRLADLRPPPAEDTPFVRETLLLPALSSTPSSTPCCPELVPAGLVSIDWLDQPDATAPICLLIPGLTGSSDSAYIRRTAVALHAAGVRVGCFNPRGRGGNALQSPFMYSAGYTEDLRRAVAHVRASRPQARALTAAGYSLGASYLAKYVCEEGDRCVLAGAALFACMTDLVAGIARLSDSAASRLVDSRVLVPSVQRVMAGHMPQLQAGRGLQLDDAASATSMAAFDGAVIAPMMGCDSATDYYTQASSGPLLTRARVPMLFVSARNDPVAPADVVDSRPFGARGGSEAAPLLLAVTREGGHSMTWPEGWRGGGRDWSTAVLCEFVAAVAEPRD